MKNKSSTRILTTSAAALLAAVFSTTAHADVFTFTGGVFTETFDNLGTAGLTTTSLTGAGSLPNDGASPWFIGVVATGTGNTAALVTTSVLDAVSAGEVAVTNTAPTKKMFNNGQAGVNPITDRALGTGNTGGDPVIDLKVKNNASGSISSMTFSFDQEYWRGGTNAATNDFGHLLYFSPTGAASTWTAIPYARTSVAYAASVDLDGNAPANKFTSGNITFSFPTAIATGGSFVLRFRDDNDPTDTDANIAIDNFTFTAAVLGGALTYNLLHSVGGGNPNGNGNLEVSANQYWLNGASPSGFAANDIANLSQNPGTTATINVPANIAVGALNVSNTSGSYSIGGAGQITGNLTKSNATTLTLTSANALTGITLTDGGTIIATASGALGTGPLTVGAGGGTIQADADQAVGGLSGAGALTKTGTGTLSLAGTGTGTAGVTVSSGKLQLSSATAIGDTAGVTLANNTTLEYNGPAGSTMTFSDATRTRVLATGANNVTISNTVVAPGSALLFDTGDSITGSGTITKAGVGTLRLAKSHAALTANWIVNGGALEAAGANSALGSGTITVNPSGVVVTNSINLQNNITLAGGALGTRTNSTSNYAGAVNVTADSSINLRSNSTQTGFQGFGITGVLSGAGKLTTVGAVPMSANANVATALTLSNIGNTYSGTINVTSQTFVANAVTAGTGSALGTATINLQGGTFRALDNSTGDNTTVVYGNNVTVSAPSEIGALAGVGTIHVERQAAPGTAVNNTVQFGTLGIAGGQSLGVTGANGYSARFSGAATISTPGVVTINTSTANLTLAGGFSGTGSLTKTGAGTLTIGTSAAHTGNTTVNGGTLDVAGVGTFTVGAGQTLSGAGGTVNGAINVSGGGTLAPGNAAGVGTLSLSNLTIGGAAINYSWNTGTLGQVTVTTSDALATTGAVTLNFAGQNPTVGLHTLIAYSGSTLTNPQYSNFTIGSIFSRIDAVLQNNAGQLALNVTGVKYPIWSGAVSTEWSTNPIGGAQNWNLNAGGGPTDFITSDKVIFDNSAVGAAPIVDISVGNVTPVSVEVTGTKNYTFNGTAGIAGATTLVNNGTGTLTINNPNSFTGAAILNAGTTSVATVADSGTNSPLGAGTTINLDTTGTLEFTGVTGSTNRALTVAAGGGAVSAPTGSTLTLAGVVSGAGTLEKKGLGTVVLTGATNTPTAVTISAGTLQIGNGVAAGSIGAGAITNNGTLAFNTIAAGLAVPNTITGTGGLTVSGAGAVTLNGAAVANTFTGDTVVNSGGLVFSHTTGTNSIGGNLIVNGGTVNYGATAGQIADHIPSTASITVTGGTFGGTAGRTVDNPLTGLTETAASLSISGGTFLSGRNDAGTFALSGAFNATGGTTIVQRGGSVTALSMTLGSGATVSFDGGSTVFASRLFVGASGLTLNGPTINLNAGPSGMGATSQGSLIVLSGNVAVPASTTLNRINITELAPRAGFDVNGADRAFNVAAGQTLTLGTTSAPVSIVNAAPATTAGFVKQGDGNMIVSGDSTYNGATTVSGGTLTLIGTLSGTTGIDVQSGTTFNVSGVAGGYALGATQTLKGNGDVVGSATINGTLAPGASIGTLDFLNDVSFGATGIAGFEINKTGLTLSADLANVTGTLTLGGTLNVTGTGDALVEGDTFNLFDAASFAGTMAMGTMPTLDPGLFWDIADLSVDGTISVIPEPGSLALLALGGTLLFRRRRQA